MGRDGMGWGGMDGMGRDGEVDGEVGFGFAIIEY